MYTRLKLIDRITDGNKMKKGLIVVDMLNDFIKQDGALFCGPTAQAIVPFIKARIEEYRANKHPVIFLADDHAIDDKEFNRFPKHCVMGTHGAEIIDELNFTTGVDSLVRKTRYSGFYNTTLDFTLNVHFGLKPNNSVIEVVGVCTSICVMDTVGDLSNRDWPVVIHKNCVADFDPEMHNMALKRMANLYGAEII
jgi:nicotinamidase-related amidase